MTVDRVRVNITGSGVTGSASMSLYLTSATPSNLTAVGAFITAIKAYIPNTLTYTVPSVGDTLDDTTGRILGAWSATAPSPIVGTGLNIASALSGFFVDWKTATVIDGHRPTGKTIIVPAAPAVYATSGYLLPAAVTVINAAAANLISGTVGFVIWHRPLYSKTKPPTLLRPGALVPVQQGVCSTKPTVLRSRRD